MRIAKFAGALGLGLLAGLGTFAGLTGPAQVQLKEGNVRGELLYSTHCKGCHATEIHWRDKKLATDWDSLKIQVRLWQAASALGWSEDDITVVTRYLNDTFYHFPETGRRISGE